MQGFPMPRGNSGIARHAALDHAHRMEERKPVGVCIGLQSGFVHQAADRKVRHQQTEEFPLYQFRRLATQYNLSAP